jgi:hypothetical protein
MKADSIFSPLVLGSFIIGFFAAIMLLPSTAPHYIPLIGFGPALIVGLFLVALHTEFFLIGCTIFATTTGVYLGIEVFAPGLCAFAWWFLIVSAAVTFVLYYFNDFCYRFTYM